MKVDGENTDDHKKALNFMKQMYGKTNIDEDEFNKKFKKFMKKSGNRSSHNFKRCYSTITKSKKLLRPPRTLCIHLNRLSYNEYGDLRLNRSKVHFPMELDLSSIKDPICPFNIGLKYKLCSVIEHIGSPLGGHYINLKKVI